MTPTVPSRSEADTVGPDLPLGQAALQRGYVTAPQLEECLRAQEDSHRSGQPLQLGQILLKKGYLTTPQFLTLLDGRKSGPLERLGRYRLKREIARGGMGTVYEAEDVELQRRVALKILHEGDREAVARFHREATVAAQLMHPDIVTIHEVGMLREPSGRTVHFIAMDFVEGVTLAALLGDGASPKRQVLGILERVARAVAFAHSKGVIHRDLKPANVLVGDGGRVVLTDFGLARAETVEGAMTRSQTVLGTPQYMAPEQVEGKVREQDARTDGYALGVILYEILVGHPPFQAESLPRLYPKILHEDPIPPRRLVPSIDPDLELVCMKALEKSPEHRYATAADFADDLRRCLDGEPIHASRIGWWRRAARKWQRNRVLVTLAAALALVSVCGAALLGWREWRGQRRLEEERASHRKREESLKRLAADWWVITERKRELRQLKVPVDRAARDLEAAIGAAEVYARDYPEDPQGYYVRARGLLYLGRLEEAEADARLSIAKRPDFRPGWSLLGLVRMEQYTEAPFRLLDLADSADLARLLEEAAEAFRRGWEPGRETEEAQRWGLGWTREDRVLERVAHALRLHLDPSRADEARNLLRNGVEEYRAEEYAKWLGVWSTTPEEKRAWLDRAIEWSPGDAIVHFYRGIAREHQGDWEGAVADYGRAIELRGDFALAYVNRGNLRRAAKRFAEALADYDRAIELKPDFAVAYGNRGTTKQALGRTADALADYDQAIRLRPKYATPYFNRALVRTELRQFQEALEDLDRAVERKPDYTKAHVYRGQVKLRLEDFQGALADFRRAADLRSDYADAHAGQGDALRALGKLAEAEAAYARALELAPPNWPRREEIEMILRKLRGNR